MGCGPAEVAFADFFVATAADQRQLHEVLGRVCPAVALQPDEFRAMTPCVRIGIVGIFEVAEKSKVLPKKQMLADNGFRVHTVLVAANRSHRYLPGFFTTFVHSNGTPIAALLAGLPDLYRISGPRKRQRHAFPVFVTSCATWRHNSGDAVWCYLLVNE